MHLVAGKRQQIHPQSVNIDPAPGKQLGGVRMKHCPSGMRDLRDLRQGGKHAGLVVGSHHCHQQSLIVNGILKALKINDAPMIHRDQDHIGIVGRKRPERLQNRWMLRGHADDAASPRVRTVNKALAGQGCLLRWNRS